MSSPCPAVLFLQGSLVGTKGFNSASFASPSGHVVHGSSPGNMSLVFVPSLLRLQSCRSCPSPFLLLPPLLSFFGSSSSRPWFIYRLNSKNCMGAFWTHYLDLFGFGHKHCSNAKPFHLEWHTLFCYLSKYIHTYIHTLLVYTHSVILVI